MATNSMPKFILDCPVPVTPFNQTVATDINKSAMDTTRKTGIPSCIKPSP